MADKTKTCILKRQKQNKSTMKTENTGASILGFIIGFASGCITIILIIQHLCYNGKF